MRKRRKKEFRATKPIEWWLGRVFLRGLIRLVRLIPYRLLDRPGAFLGDAGYLLFPRYRRTAMRNLKRAFGDAWSADKMRRVARASFRNVATTLLEALWMPLLSTDDLRRMVRLEGREHLDAALSRGHGAILFSAHYGNWEIMAPRLVDAGYRISTIARDADDPGVNQVLNDIRRGAGQEMLPRSRATRPALACLRRNEVLALLLDQNTLKGGIFVDFFGIPAATATGPAALAQRTGAPLVPIFSTRQPDRSHHVRILPPIYPDPSASPEPEIGRLTAAATHVIEDQIRARPEQWMWLHNRWKLRPDGTVVE